MTIKPRCDFTGCTRYARSGSNRCTAHRNAVDRRGQEPNELEATLSAIDLGKLNPRVGQAAADADPNLDNEISVLRTVMNRLLTAEEDPSKLATGVAKVASVIIAGMKAKKTLSGENADEFTDAVAFLLDQLK